MNNRDDVLEFIKIELERIKSAQELKESSKKGVSEIFLKHEKNITPPVYSFAEVSYGLDYRGVLSNEVSDSEYSKELCLDNKEDSQDKSMIFDSIPESASSSDFITNVPLRSLFTEKIIKDNQTFVAMCKLNSTEEQISLEKQKEISMCINKRLSQVSTNKKHLDRIYNDLKKYAGTYFFLKTFVNRILDQGRIQVSKHPKSYIAYSYMLCVFYSEEMMYFFRFTLFTLKFESLSGAYLIYFGILKLKQKFKEAYAFIIAVIEAYKDGFSAEIIENFLSVLGYLISNKLPKQFNELSNIIQDRILFKIENKGRTERISSIIKDLAEKRGRYA